MTQSLLDLVSIQMGCEYLSDLRFLDSGQRAALAWKLERIPPGKYQPVCVERCAGISGGRPAGADPGGREGAAFDVVDPAPERGADKIR